VRGRNVLIAVQNGKKLWRSSIGGIIITENDCRSLDYFWLWDYSLGELSDRKFLSAVQNGTKLWRSSIVIVSIAGGVSSFRGIGALGKGAVTGSHCPPPTRNGGGQFAPTTKFNKQLSYIMCWRIID
jgi:hypothetical protein